MARRDARRSQEDKRLRYSVRRNVRHFDHFEWARSATKHRISRPRSRFVVEEAVWWLEQSPPTGYPEGDLRLLFFGDDQERVPLEVVAVEPEERCLIIIHAMPLRDRHQGSYEEARRWQERRNIR